MMFIQQWDAFLWPLVSASSRECKVIQVSIAEFTGENYIDWSLIYSATTLAILIPAVILVPLQKYFIQGVAGTGIKE
jgi:multiple sugar transport system permease protein/putative chitobiose transport system permease protein